MTRGVKSKKIRRPEGNKLCHDFHYRDAILSPETKVIGATEIVVRFLVACHDYAKIVVRFLSPWCDLGAPRFAYLS